MTSAHFNISNVKKSLQDSGSVVQNSKLDWIRRELDYLKQFTHNTIYNFYSEGVLKRYVLRLKSSEPSQIDYRVKLYWMTFGGILLLGFLDSRRHKARSNED